MPDPAPHFPPPPEMGTTHSAEYQGQQLYETIIHLRGLGIGYYIMAGFCVLGCLCGGAYMGMFGVIFGIASQQPTAQNEPGAQAALSIFALFIGAMMLLMVAVTIGTASLLYFTGKFLRKQQRYTVCLIGSILCCLYFPLGTLLGVFTIILLNRDGVKELFAQNDLRAAESSQKEKTNAG